MPSEVNAVVPMAVAHSPMLVHGILKRDVRLLERFVESKRQSGRSTRRVPLPLMEHRKHHPLLSPFPPFLCPCP